MFFQDELQFKDFQNRYVYRNPQRVRSTNSPMYSVILSEGSLSICATIGVARNFYHGLGFLASCGGSLLKPHRLKSLHALQAARPRNPLPQNAKEQLLRLRPEQSRWHAPEIHPGRSEPDFYLQIPPKQA